MARAYEDDLRRKIFEAHAKGHGSFQKLAGVFGVSLGYVEKIFRQRQASGQPERVRYRPGPKSRLSPEVSARIARLVESPPMGPATWPAAEKKSLHAIERDTEANRKRREEFVEHIGSIPPERLIYLDESGVTTSMTRLYGRCVGGRRIAEATPGGHWKILTILSAMSTRGMIATMTIDRKSVV